MTRIAVYFLLSTAAVLATCPPLTAQNWRPVSVLQQDYVNTLGQQAPFPEINGQSDNGQPNNGQPNGAATPDNGTQEFSPPLVSPPVGGVLPGPYPAGSCCPDPCCGDVWSYNQPCWCGSHGGSVSRGWYASADALWLNRNDSNRRNLSVEDGGIQLTTDALEHDHTSGARITLGHFLDDCTSLEGSFFGFFDWNAQKSVQQTGYDGLNPYWNAYDSPGGLQGFNNAVEHRADYSTELVNAELGVRRWVDPDASVLFGFRFMSIDEDFDFYSTRSTYGTSLYSVHTDNELVGLQIGGDWSRLISCEHVRFTLAGKAGMFLNFAEQDNHISDQRFWLWRSNEANETNLASIFEVSATLTVKVTDCFSIRGGYQHMFITGLALATDHLDGNPDHANAGTFMSTEGSLHLSGPFVGGELILP